MPKPPMTAFAFAGGGSLGAVQVGMLRALLEYGIDADWVVGSSVGAISAAHFAGEPSLAGVERLENIWSRVRRADVFPVARLRVLRMLLLSRDALLDVGPLRRLIIGALPFQRLEETSLPCTIVATDLTSGSEVRLTAGPAADALLASAAIPGVLPPVQIGTHDLIDGGIASNTPIHAAVDAGADRVIVLPTGFACAAPSAPRGALSIALHALNLLVAHQLVRDVAWASGQSEVYVVPSLCPLDVSSYDFTKTGELIQQARASTRTWLEGGGLRRPGVTLGLAPHDHREVTP